MSFDSSPSGDDYVVKETATLNWTINGFSNLNNKVGSEIFQTKNFKNQFRLYLSPKTNVLSSNEVFVSLYYYCNENELSMRYRVSIVNVNGEKQYSQEYQWNYCKTGKNSRYEYVNFNNFIEYNSYSRYLVNGNLILKCEVDILEKCQLAPNKTTSTGDTGQTNLQNDYQTLLENSEFSDVSLLLKEKEFKVHKNILAARSKVFRAMFSADLEEKKQNRVEITDVEVDVFEQLLFYIYTGKIPEMDEYALELFVASDKYQLDHLKPICEQYFDTNLTTESVVNVLVISDMHNASELKSKCIEYITLHLDEVKGTDAWKEMKSRPVLLMELLDSFSEKMKSLSTKS